MKDDKIEGYKAAVQSGAIDVRSHQKENQKVKNLPKGEKPKAPKGEKPKKEKTKKNTQRGKTYPKAQLVRDSSAT